MPHRIPFRLLACLAAAIPAAAAAGNFGVAPTRIDLDRGTRTAIVEVSNDDDRKLNFQVKLAEWTQDAEGRDHYADSQDLIWFPQIFAVNAKEKRSLRVGLKQGPAPTLEKAYRLFVEEIPEPRESQAGAQVNIVLRFGLPIFVAPAAPQKRFAIESVTPTAGRVVVRIRSDGTQGERFSSLKLLRGGEVVAEGPAWYVLAGSTGRAEVKVEPSRCPLAGPLEIAAEAEGLVLKQPFDASQVLCPRP